MGTEGSVGRPILAAHRHRLAPVRLPGPPASVSHNDREGHLMARYAKDTGVSVERTKAELETIITKYGADSFATMNSTSKGIAAIMFELHERRVVFELPLPKLVDFATTSYEVKASRDGRRAHTKTTEHSAAKQRKLWEQACRQRWRALALAVKAKLEAVASGITSFEEEFLAHIMLPNGSTVGKHMVPQLQAAYDNNTMPPLLPGIGETS